MEKKAVSGIMLTLLLTSMLTLALNIGPAKAEETIYILPDGTVYPSTAPISKFGDVYTFTSNIDDQIVVQRSNIVIDGNSFTVQGFGDGNGLRLYNINNVTIKNVNVKNFYHGLQLEYSSNINISHNNIFDDDGFYTALGISLYYSSRIIISENTITDVGRGIYVHMSNYNKIFRNDLSGSSYGAGISLYQSSYNIISENIVSNNVGGIYVVDWSSDNRIFHNYLINNRQQSWSVSSLNVWDDGYSSGGNHWSDYRFRYPTVGDAYHGENQDIPGGDGIWDQPYIIDADNRDRYPLVTPDFSITAFPDVLTIGQGASDMSIITITSLGGFDQQVELTVTSMPIVGVSITLNPLLVTPPPNEFATSVLTVEVAADTVANWYMITVSGTSDSLQHSVYIVFVVVGPPPVVMATVDIDPDALNLRSKGHWVTAYIQLLEGYNATDVDASTILLNETIQPVLDPKYDFVTNSNEYLVDHNNDGILERMVKFDRATLESWIYQSAGMQSDVSLTITGELTDGTKFEGTDIVFVFFGGGGGRRK